jgi:hypothetical protein
MKIAESTISDTGLKTTIGFQDEKLVVSYEQDVEPSLDYATALRNSTDYSKQGIKDGLWHTVHIPESVCLQMMVEDGFDPYKSPASELRKFLVRNRAKYSRLFTTGGKV